MDFKKLEKDLYDIANNLVGNVGPGLDKKLTRLVWQQFAFFSIYRELPLRPIEVVGVWKKWIKAYCDFKKLHTPEAAQLIENPDLIVHWLKKPTVERELGNESSDFVLVKAYLIICRTDCDPELPIEYGREYP